MLSQKVRRKPSDEDDSDADQEEVEEDGNTKAKKGRKEAKEIHMHARKTDDAVSSSMSDMRRDMLRAFAAEESEEWIPIRYRSEVRYSYLTLSFISLTIRQGDSTRLLEQIVAPNDTQLQCTSTMASML